MKKILLLYCLIFSTACGPKTTPIDSTENNQQKMNGLSVVSPPKKFESELMQPMLDINAKWLGGAL